ncbi:Ribosomal protein L7Ae [Lutispora thermophila DSM 19022]|uniref:Ribosomal protein L7Ae n=2 Tax=Lutispora TaxID=667112 RepID=A0A1M6I4X5_9FIRM|nr:Ribosomal protein L7Ae [Lutispora thermophila DSM 19022]
MLGMAYKAGQVVTGEDTTRNAIRKNRVKLLIIAEDASDNTKKRFINSSVYYNVPYVICLTKIEMSRSLGQKIRSVAGIIDEGIAKYLMNLVENCV